MITYLAHTNGSIAACESVETTRKREALGFVVVSGALHRVLWQRKDRQALSRLAWAVGGREREFGGWTIHERKRG